MEAQCEAEAEFYMKFLLEGKPKVCYLVQQSPLNEFIGANRIHRYKSANSKTVRLTHFCENKIHFVSSQLFFL
jgi:hypothetical protein